MARHQAATGGSQLPAVTTVKHADLSSGVVVECVLLPTNSRRRHRYPLETTLSQLASETEKALARPAKVISISRFPDRNDSHREPLPFTTDLRSLGAETGGFLTLEVALRRTEEDITQELPEEEGKRNGGEEETDKMTANTFGARERISEETDEEHGHSEGGACQLIPGLPGEVNPAVSIAIERWRAFSSGINNHNASTLFCSSTAASQWPESDKNVYD
ncbi:hypothetical protein TGPRC2_364690 [Toxoplasma gondii TgCatPRC2]|uniref:Uncharacterized protein n=3 Tax=Toxoplasma gondii TaxID=5811 RepID=A0A151HQV0_TOXGO|nr:hypothetical protein TGDOM2_364690 [Toxoplasma gondii GAB2-2007-GAL-DOM2]KYF42197.1 hypothetical protein TGARI_364690 [Toxoplasma gondii ARI]KYK71722.1 hypothetical protein TGPRC2_364690 [Toxoplasma gondii TgCatPRC2]